MQETSTRDVNLNINDSMNAGKSNQLGKHSCTTLLERVLIKRISRFDTDFTSQMKLTKPSLMLSLSCTDNFQFTDQFGPTGGELKLWKQECIPVGCVPPAQWPSGGCLPGGCLPRGVSCDLSHHAFDITCTLSRHQLSVNTSAAAYIVWPRCMLGYTPPPHVNRMTDRCKNITLPQLRLRAVTTVVRIGTSFLSGWNKILQYFDISRPSVKYPIHIGHFDETVDVSVQTHLRLVSSDLTLESFIQWSKHVELEIAYLLQCRSFKSVVPLDRIKTKLSWLESTVTNSTFFTKVTQCDFSSGILWWKYLLHEFFGINKENIKGCIITLGVSSISPRVN